MSIAAWGTETGLDNGFAIGENYTWFLKIDDQDFAVDQYGSIMSTSVPFSDSYSLNGLDPYYQQTFLEILMN